MVMYYKFDPEEIILYTLCRIATGLPSATIVDMYFGGAHSRWGYGYRFILDYIDQRYASILGHQGLLWFIEKFPDFHRLEHYCQRDHIRYDANNIPETVPGLNHYLLNTTYLGLLMIPLIKFAYHIRDLQEILLEHHVKYNI
jgi:hypothetical protein